MNAPGSPGSEPHWTGGYKEGMGTAVSASSPVWFSLSHGILNEVYYPRLDMAAVRDAQLLVVDNHGGFWEEKRDLTHDTQYLDEMTPGFSITNREPEGRFTIKKRIITWPRLPVLLQSIDVETDGDAYRWFFLLAPHLDNHGYGNSAILDTLRDGTPAMLVWRDGYYICQTASHNFTKQSVGYVGFSDGWTELKRTGDIMSYDRAENGNLAIIGEWPALPGQTQCLITSFGRTEREAKFAAHLAMNESYDGIEQNYVSEWHHFFHGLGGILPSSHPHARMQKISAMVLKTHQDKIFSGGIIASLSVPWGNAASDGNIGGYHLVWPRDMVEAANAFLTLDDVDDARLALDFLRACQSRDGSWPQNFWLNGEPYWAGSQLDETAFPIHLAYQISRRQPDVDVYPMVIKALAYVVQNGPVTQEERWEEDGGYSPSTLAAMIAALILGGQIAREHGDEITGEYVESLADYWTQSLNRWTFTEEGTAVPGHPRHYERIHPEADIAEDGNIHKGYVPIKNLPGGQLMYPEVAVIDGGFLELVRYGIKQADDPHIVDSVQAYDAGLKVEMPYGPVWHRYNHDGYGEGPHGEPYTGVGLGRAWPLLSGERGHYDLALGLSAESYLSTMEQAATAGGLIPEQVWDAEDVPEHELFFGRPTGSASPLVWAHSEFLKLLHSQETGHVFEQYAPVAERYAHFVNSGREFWQFNHQIQNWNPGTTVIRVATVAPARLVFTLDDWKTSQTVDLSPTPLGCFYADVDLQQASALEFTFYWSEAEKWEGKNFQITADPL